jgi:hypothetical protein
LKETKLMEIKPNGVLTSCAVFVSRWTSKDEGVGVLKKLVKNLVFSVRGCRSLLMAVVSKFIAFLAASKVSSFSARCCLSNVEASCAL